MEARAKVFMAFLSRPRSKRASSLCWLSLALLCIPAANADGIVHGHVVRAKSTQCVVPGGVVQMEYNDDGRYFRNYPLLADPSRNDPLQTEAGVFTTRPLLAGT